MLKKWALLKHNKPEDKKVKMFVGDKEIIGIHSFKISTIPWYLRWWFDWKLHIIYKRHYNEVKRKKEKKNA